jgi:hypothetical protein
MKLRDIARAKVEDAGMLVEVSVVASDARDYRLIERVVTTSRVRQHLDGAVQKTVIRYAQPHLGALTFVLWPTLADTGSISTRLLQMDVLPAPSRFQRADDPPARLRVC